MTNSLAAYAGQNAQIRFLYDYTSGGYYNQTDPGVGFYVDDISVLNAEQLASPVTNTVAAGTSFYFVPTNSIDSLVAVRAVLPGRTLNWGPSLRLGVSAAAPTLQLAAKPVVLGNQIQLDFNVSNYRAGTTFQLWKSASPAGTWTLDTGASFSTLVPNSAFRATTSTLGAGSMFYKVKADLLT